MTSTIRELHPALAETALKELNEDPKTRGEYIQNIKDWLNTQPHLKVNPDDQWILIFLRFSKFSLERAKERIDAFHTVKSITPELQRVTDIREEKLQVLLRTGFCLNLPAVGPPNFPRLFMIRPFAIDAVKTTVETIFRLMHLTVNIALYVDDVTTVAGQIVIVDSTYNSDLLKLLTPSNIKLIVNMGQDVIPVRTRASHFFNVSPAAEVVFNIMKVFMNEKHKKRFTVHQKIDTVFDHIPRESFPEEYGGGAGPIQDIIDKEAARIESHNAWFMEVNMKYRNNESLRPKKQGNDFGIEGSFRKLNVD